MIEPNTIIVIRDSESQETYGRLSFIAVSDGALFGVAPSQLVDAESKRPAFLEHQSRSIIDFVADSWMSDGLLTAFPLDPSTPVKNPIYAEKFQVFSEFVEEDFKVGSIVWFGSATGTKGEIVSARYRPIEASLPQAWHSQSFQIVETKGVSFSDDTIGSLVCSEDGRAVGVVLGVNSKHAMVYKFDRLLFDNDLLPATDGDVNLHNETLQNEADLGDLGSNLEHVVLAANKTLGSFGLKKTGSVHKLRRQFEALFESQGLLGRRDAVGTASSLSVVQSFLSILSLFPKGSDQEVESFDEEGQTK